MKPHSSDGSIAACDSSVLDRAKPPLTGQSHDRFPVPAGMVRRGLAALIDLVVVVATLYGLQAAVELSVIGSWPGLLDNRDGEVVRQGAESLVVAVAYCAECWSRSGRTVGAAALGLRVVGRDGLLLRPAEAMLRAVVCLLLPLGLLSATVDGQRRSLQDIVFGSRVIFHGMRSFAQPCRESRRSDFTKDLCRLSSNRRRHIHRSSRPIDRGCDSLGYPTLQGRHAAR